jgi:hypothetical protein
MVPSSGIVIWTLDLDVGLVRLVDEQDRGVGTPDRGQQRPAEQELLREHVVVDLVPAVVVLARLDAQELLLVVPLVERARLVEPLVALQPDELGTNRGGDRLRELGLADACGPLDEQRLAEAVRQEDRRRDGVVGQVAGGAEARLDVGDVGELGLQHGRS